MRDQWFEMSYNKPLECWLVVKDDTGYIMHCGECFELYISDNKCIPCRLELAREWFIVMGSEDLKLNLKKNEVYKIRI